MAQRSLRKGSFFRFGGSRDVRFGVVIGGGKQAFLVIGADDFNRGYEPKKGLVPTDAEVLEGSRMSEIPHEIWLMLHSVAVATQ